jgi:hypothetical protein
MTTPTEELRIEYRPISELLRAPRNPKKHDKPGIRASMDRWGFTAAILLDERTGRIEAGHGRLDELQRRNGAGEPPPRRIRVRADGAWLVPCVLGVAFDNPAEAEAYLLADNRLVENGGGYDDTELVAMLRDVVKTAQALAGTGFDEAALAELVRSTGAGVEALAAGDAFGRLPTGKKLPFQTVTFTLHDDQVEVLRRAMERARPDATHHTNKNGNGNALTLICEVFLGRS